MKESGENIHKDVLGQRFKGKFYQQSSLGEGTPAYMEGLVDSPSPPFPPPSPVCFFLSKQLTIFRLRKQVNTLSLIECDPLLENLSYAPEYWTMFLFDKVLQALVVKAKQSFGLILTLLCNLSKLQQDYSFIQIIAQRTQERTWESKVVTYVCVSFNPMSDQDRISPYRTNIISTR